MANPENPETGTGDNWANRKAKEEREKWQKLNEKIAQKWGRGSLGVVKEQTEKAVGDGSGNSGSSNKPSQS